MESLVVFLASLHAQSSVKAAAASADCGRCRHGLGRAIQQLPLPPPPVVTRTRCCRLPVALGPATAIARSHQPPRLCLEESEVKGIWIGLAAGSPLLFWAKGRCTIWALGPLCSNIGR
ncbi:hypothetical protein PVAP13_8NG074802 [Panicum virgatum]|uniref:Secreted protein n=1 Tax=Panicum virgatum TaxID=38727 RepID=A0A8T0PCP7_PANVG|nr:hypothetical protein PVAP13_8NG074802 [Panicum virgatum]